MQWEPFLQETYNQRRVGLHHWCFRARNREDIDKLQRFFDTTLAPLGGTLLQPAMATTGGGAGVQDAGGPPGYYSILFADPEGMHCEVNFVPGKGLLAPKKKSKL